MAEAARSTKHYVSDSLAERYPYDASNGFAGARQKNAGAVYNGYDALGTANLMHSLTDPFVNAEGKAKAAHHLYSRSAAQEAKIDMLQHGLVPLLVATLTSSPDVVLRHQCLLLLRSLAVIPQGCYALVFQGAIAPTVKALRASGGVAASQHSTKGGAEGEAEEAELRCRVAAGHVLYQVSSNLSGLRWLLGVPHETAVAGLEVDRSVVPLLPEELVDEVVEVLAEHAGQPHNAKAHQATKLHGYLLQTLAHLTSLPRGVEALLTSSTALPTVAAFLPAGSAAADASPTTSPSATNATDNVGLSESALEILWNVALDPAGGAAQEAAAIPQLLFDAFASVCVNINASPVSLQRQLTGALSAVHQLTSVKLASTEPLSPSSSAGGDTRIAALVRYLRQWNGVIEVQYSKANKTVPSGVAAIQKNTVQCIRLASEVRAVRDATHAMLDECQRADATEAFHLCRQLYFRTKWEAEYHASVEL